MPKIRDRDRGYRKTIRAIRKGRHGTVTVGIHSGDGSKERKSGLTVARLGAIHEFGEGVPQRSWLGGWFEANQSDFGRILNRELTAALKRRESIKIAMRRIALKLQGSIQRRFREGIGPELAASTIARKGSTKQLIDKGILRSSITGKVESE
jgi:hypothetical protein